MIIVIMLVSARKACLLLQVMGLKQESQKSRVALSPDVALNSMKLASMLSHRQRSLAQSSHFEPWVLANASKSSSHLVVGLPLRRFPPSGTQCSMRVVHRPSVRLAACPAHFHFRLLCSVTHSDTAPFRMCPSSELAVRFSQSTQLSFTSSAESSSPSSELSSASPASSATDLAALGPDDPDVDEAPLLSLLGM